MKINAKNVLKGSKFLDIHFLKVNPAANHAIVSYNASALKLYDATSSLVHF
jgi:hypothetical protein